MIFKLQVNLEGSTDAVLEEQLRDMDALMLVADLTSVESIAGLNTLLGRVSRFVVMKHHDKESKCAHDPSVGPMVYLPTVILANKIDLYNSSMSYTLQGNINYDTILYAIYYTIYHSHNRFFFKHSLHIPFHVY